MSLGHTLDQVDEDVHTYQRSRGRETVGWERCHGEIKSQGQKSDAPFPGLGVGEVRGQHWVQRCRKDVSREVKLSFPAHYLDLII